MNRDVLINKIQNFISENYKDNFQVDICNNKNTIVSIDLIDVSFKAFTVFSKSISKIQKEISEYGEWKFWSNLKILLEKHLCRVFERGDLFWGEKDLISESEQGGFRPYIVISNNMNNKFSSMLTVIPLTTQSKSPIPAHCSVMINGVKCTVLCEQISCIYKRDLRSFIRTLTVEEIERVEKPLKLQLGLSHNEETNNRYESRNQEEIKNKIK